LPNLKEDQKEAIAKIRAFEDFEIIYGGSVLPEQVNGLRGILPNAKLFAGFGMTEMSPAIAHLSKKDYENTALLRSIGQPLP